MEPVLPTHRRRIALVAHDHKKSDLLDWAATHRELLAHHELFGTGTTGGLIAERLGLDVTRFHSGPLGGDQQLGARIADGGIACGGCRRRFDRTRPRRRRLRGAQRSRSGEVGSNDEPAKPACQGHGAIVAERLAANRPRIAAPRRRASRTRAKSRWGKRAPRR